MRSAVSVDQARRSLPNRLRHLFGLRQTFRIAGVRYRELSADSLRRALSRAGPGSKDFEASFRDGSTMRLRCTRDRIYADIAGPKLAGVCLVAEPLLRPGHRVLIPRGGTGYVGAWVAGRVAPSGAVVSLETDEESVEYARRRYRLPNASFEKGGLEALEGETDGAFAGVLVIDAEAMGETEAACRSLWRLIRPGGWIFLAAMRRAESLAAALKSCGPGVDPLILSDSADDWSAVRAEKPADPADV